MCGVGINDSIALFFGVQVLYAGYNESTRSDLTKLVLDIKSWSWIEIDYEFHDMNEIVPIGYAKEMLELSCTTLLTKTSIQ